MRVEIELNHDEVRAAVLAYLRTNGLAAVAVDVTHATGDQKPIQIEHNYDRDRLVLHIVAEVKGGIDWAKPNKREAVTAVKGQIVDALTGYTRGSVTDPRRTG